MGADCCLQRDLEEEEAASRQATSAAHGQSLQLYGSTRVLGMHGQKAVSSHNAGSRYVFSRHGFLDDFYEPVGDNTKLGEGSFGQVHLVRNRRNLALRALKVVDKEDPGGTKKDLTVLRSELEMMTYTDHPHVARLFEVFEDEHALYLILEYCSGGDLMVHLTAGGRADINSGVGYKMLSERQVARLKQQVLSAVAHLHALSIAHRDIKPANFVFLSPAADAPLKLIDFGTAKFSFSKSLYRVLGTPDYASPEQMYFFLNHVMDDTGDVTCACDMWAVGVMMHMMLTGVLPRSVNRKILYIDPENYVDKQYKLLEASAAYDFTKPEWTSVSEEAKSLLASLLQFSPERRLAAARALQHPWFFPYAHRDQQQSQQTLGPDLAERLTSFVRRSKLEQAALGLAADRMRGSRELQHLRDVWHALDGDTDGFVSLEDIDMHIARTGLVVPSGFRRALAALAGTDGRVALNQFLAATLEPQKLRERSFAKEVFQALDLDGSGHISSAELQALVGEDCGIGPDGVDEKQFYALLDQSARRVEPWLGTRGVPPSAPQLDMHCRQPRMEPSYVVPATSAL